MEGSRHQRSVAERRAGEELLLGGLVSLPTSPFGLFFFFFDFPLASCVVVFSLLLIWHASLMKNQRFLLSCLFTVPTRHLHLLDLQSPQQTRGPPCFDKSSSYTLCTRSCVEIAWAPAWCCLYKRFSSRVLNKKQEFVW